MNHFLTFVFLIFIFYFYGLIGEFVADCFGIKIKNSTAYVIYGFISLFFVSFIIGFPCQLFQLSWNVYFILFCVLFFSFFVFLLWRKYKNISTFVSEFKDSLKKEKIINHIKNNWVIYIFVFLFTLFSVSNVMALYEFDYDDAYYIAKVVNSIGTPSLMNESFYTGWLTTSVDYARIVNTYEITYGALASIFHINPVYFCKVFMVIHNYTLFALAIKQLASFVTKRKAQYALIPFFLFLIGHGYLMENNGAFLTIRSFDLWQFQNAIWYGGSVVRVLSVPIMCIVCIPLIENKMTIKNIIFAGITSCSMMSFSTVFLPILIVMFFILFILKFAYNTCISIKQKNTKWIIINLCCFLFILTLLILTKGLTHTPLLSLMDFTSFSNQLSPFYGYYVSTDTIMQYSTCIAAIALALVINSKYGKYLVIITLMLIIVVTKNKFNELLCLSSFNYFFVILRFYSAIQFMVVFLLGLSIAKILDIISFKTISVSVATLAIASSLIFVYQNYNQIKSYTFLGCGINQYGYDFTQILKYDNMMLDIFNDVGEHFNSLPYGNYTLLAPPGFTYHGKVTYQLGFYMSSNRIQIVKEGSLYEDELQFYHAIYDYWSEKASFDQTKFAFDYYRRSYFLTLSKKQADELMSHGYQLEYTNNECYVIKL